MTERREHFALFLQPASWVASVDRYQLSPEISLCKSEGAPPFTLYEKICEEKGVDDGEPYSFGSYFEVLRDDDDVPWHYCYPTSLVEDLCNLFVIGTGTVLDFSRLVMTRDHFQTCSLTFEPIDNSRQAELYSDCSGKLNDESLASIERIWLSLNSLRGYAGGGRRLRNAFDFFQFTWRSLFHDQACICLAVVLESLFSPYSQGEIGHQIAVNAARFLEDEIPDLQSTYTITKKFYDLRSRVTHGAGADYDKIEPAVNEMFQLCANILRKALGNEDLARAFCEEKKRRELLNSFVFGTKFEG